MEATIALTTCRKFLATQALVVNVTLVILGSLVIAGLAQISIPLPFTPVPITGQTFAVLLVGAALGSSRGASAVILYLVEGTAGLPFFAGGASGPKALLGPTGGYLVGFVLAAYIVGLLAERGMDRRFGSALIAFTAGECAIYLVGAPWLAYFVGPENALVMGLWPFLPGDLIKILLAGLALPSAWAFVRSSDEAAR